MTLKGIRGTGQEPEGFKIDPRHFLIFLQINYFIIPEEILQPEGADAIPKADHYFGVECKEHDRQVAVG